MTTGGLLSLLLLLALSGSALAATLVPFDARQVAMAGAGAATGEPGTAALLNPALLWPRQPLRGSWFGNGYAGARLLDREGLVDRVRAIEDADYENRLDLALANARSRFSAGTLGAADVNALAAVAEDLLTDLVATSRKPLRASASVGVAAGRVGANHAVGLHARRWLALGVEVQFAELDALRLRQLVAASGAVARLLDRTGSVAALASSLELDNVDALVAASLTAGEPLPELLALRDLPGVEAIVAAVAAGRSDLEALTAVIDVEALATALQAQGQGGAVADLDLRNYLRLQVAEQIASTLAYRGADIEEVALSFAGPLPGHPEVSIGAQLKLLDIAVIELAQPLDALAFSAWRQDQHRRSYRRATVDLGLTWALDRHWQLGLVLKNAVPFALRTPSGAQVPFAPLARAGVAYRGDRLQLAFDVDLTRNEPLGFDPDQRYLALGAEWRCWRQSTLRAGYRWNTVTRTGIASIGFSLGWQQGHMDLAVTRSSTLDELGVAVQAGIQF